MNSKWVKGTFGLVAFILVTAIAFTAFSGQRVNNTFSVAAWAMNEGGGGTDAYNKSSSDGPALAPRGRGSGDGTTGSTSTGSRSGDMMLAAPTAAMMMPEADVVAPAPVGDAPAMALNSSESVAPGDFAYRRSELRSTTGSGEPAPQAPQQQYLGPSGLKAGMVDDNASYGDYTNYLQTSADYYNVANVDMSERYYVQVLDSQQHPVADAAVTVSDGQQTIFAARTTSDGRVAFFPRSLSQQPSFRVQAERDGATASGVLERGKAESVALTLQTQSAAVNNLDLVFLLDSTGSMGDEIDGIKTTIFAISQRIAQLPGNPRVRLGLVTYRDRGDAYVSKHWDFTSDVAEFSRNLDTVYADNGGDTPEDFNSGLADTLERLTWNSDQQHSLRLVFNVTDAAPHNDYQDQDGYGNLMQKAAGMGVKVFTVAASGMTPDGEFIYRQVAAYTLARFVFLTYANASNGGGGAPGGDTTMSVSQYSVSNLDDLIVELVASEVKNQQPAVSLKPGQPLISEITTPPSSDGTPNLWPLAGALAVGGLVTVAYRRSRIVQRHNFANQPTTRTPVKAEETTKLPGEPTKPLSFAFASEYEAVPPPWYWHAGPNEQTTRI